MGKGSTELQELAERVARLERRIARREGKIHKDGRGSEGGADAPR